MSAELRAARAEARSYREIAARLTDELERLQAANEAAYVDSYNGSGGPHFCKGLPFGVPSEAVVS